jgi:hypothetical protein
MEQNELNEDYLKSPEVQDMIMGLHIGCIAAELSKRLDITPTKALSLFYESKTCAQLHDKSTGLYLYSNLYLVDEFILE